MNANEASGNTSAWKRFWRFILTPARPPKDALLFLQSRFYLLFLLLAAFLLIILALLRLITGQEALTAAFFGVLALAIYVLARVGLFETSVFLGYAIVLIVPHLLPAFLPYFYPTTSPAMLVLASTMVPLVHMRLLSLVMRAAIIVSAGIFYFTIPGMTMLATTTLVAIVALINIIMEMSSDWIQQAVTYQLRQSMPQTQALEELPALVAIIQDGALRYVNASGAALLGASQSDELLVLPPSVWIGPQTDLSTTNRLRRTSETNKSTLVYFDRLKRIDGMLLDCYITETSVRYQDRPATLLSAVPLHHLMDETPLQEILKLAADFAYNAEWDGSRFQVRWIIQSDALRIAPHLKEGRSPQLDGEMIHPDDLPLIQNHWRLLQQGQAHRVEYRVARSPGHWRWVRETASPAPNRQPLRVYGVINDVTSRLEAEDVVKQHVVQQAVVAELGLMALSGAEQSSLLKNAVILCAQALEVRACDIMEYQPQQRLLRRVAFNGEGVLADATYSALATASPASYALQTEESLSCVNTAEELRFTLPADLQRLDVRSCASVPIHGDPDIYGVLSVYSDQQRRFSDDDLHFLQSIANVLAASIQKEQAQLAERAQREFNDALREITTMISSDLALPLVLERVLQQLSRVVPHHDASTILLYNEATHTFDYASSRGYEAVQQEIEQISFSADKIDYADMIETRRPVIIPDVRQRPNWIDYEATSWIRSYAGAPIFVGDRCIGIINLDSARPNAFTSEDADRLMAFADKIAIAIQNARYANELERLVQQRTDELQQERARIEAILEATGEGIFYLEEGLIRFVNPALLELTGFQSADLVGKPATRLLPVEADKTPAMRFNELLEPPLTNRIWRGEFRLARRDGTNFEAELTISRVREDEKASPRLVILVRDISARKLLEEQKTRFIANAAHELRTPITNLNTRLYLMKRHPARAQENFEALERIAVRMNRLVSDLLDLSYFDHGRISLRQEAVLLPQLVQEVVSIQQAEADQKGIEIQIVEDPNDAVYVLGDEQRLQQVFTNLIVNAILYTPAGGHVRVLTQRLPSGRVEVTVEDDGPGIPAEKIPYLFQPFYRLNDEQKGTGLGLAISHEIVKRHHGELRVESEPGRGTRFMVVLDCLSTA